MMSYVILGILGFAISETSGGILGKRIVRQRLNQTIPSNHRQYRLLTRIGFSFIYTSIGISIAFLIAKVIITVNPQAITITSVTGVSTSISANMFIGLIVILASLPQLILSLWLGRSHLEWIGIGVGSWTGGMIGIIGIIGLILFVVVIRMISGTGWHS